MTRDEARADRIAREDHEAREARALGVDQLQSGAVDVAAVVRRVDANVRAARAGDWRNVEVGERAAVRFNFAPLRATCRWFDTATFGYRVANCLSASLRRLLDNKFK